MFIPTTPEELEALGWESLDVILVSGDTYIDSPYSGVALLGHQLIRAGYKTGIIAQPNLNNPTDIARLGMPRLFWGISAGMVDSMVANTTALGKPRRMDDNTPGGVNNRRPNRASIVYTNLIRRWFKNPAPIVLGGIEASLRRMTHYDFWSDSLRRPILLDAKADYLLYGMADHAILELAETLKMRGDPRGIRGLCYASSDVPAGYIELPSFEACELSKEKFIDMFRTFYVNNDPVSAKGLAQRSGNRYVIQNPPAPALTTEEMDEVYAADYENAVHPYYARMGEVRAMDTIRNSIVTHRGCYGECNFCAIALHEGRRISWRSKDSILAEAEKLTEQKGFRGIIHDLSGPTANMYGYDCAVKNKHGACKDKSCIYPEVCPSLGLNHKPHLELLQSLRELPGVRKIFVGSGIRYDMVMADKNHGPDYLEELAAYHVSGQLKLAPEHSEKDVLDRMRKPGTASLLAFKEAFEAASEKHRLNQFLTYYIIAAHPGCSKEHMIELQNFATSELGILPEQVQIFTPTPSTVASVMYYTEMDPFTGEKIFVEKSETGKMQQKALIAGWRGKPAKTPGKGFDRKPDRDKPRRPQSEEPRRETRVVRDDEGGFFMNRKPEGWVDKKDRKRPYRPAPGEKDDRRRGPRPDGDGPKREYDRSRRDDDRPKRDYDKPRRDGDRPQRSYDKPRRDGDRPKRDYDKPRRDGDRPQRNYDKPRRDGDRPKRDYDKPRREGDRPQRSYDKPRRDGGDKPKRSYDKPRRDGGDKPKRSYDKPKRDGDRPQRNYDKAKRDSNRSKNRG